MSEQKVLDRRRHRRLSVAAKLDLGPDSCSLKDISPIGAAAISRCAVEEMTLVEFRVELGARSAHPLSLRCQAVVVRCDRTGDDEWELGLFFADVDDAKRREIERFIDAALSPDMPDVTPSVV